MDPEGSAVLGEHRCDVEQVTSKAAKGARMLAVVAGAGLMLLNAQRLEEISVSGAEPASRSLNSNVLCTSYSPGCALTGTINTPRGGGPEAPSVGDIAAVTVLSQEGGDSGFQTSWAP